MSTREKQLEEQVAILKAQVKRLNEALQGILTVSQKALTDNHAPQPILPAAAGAEPLKQTLTGNIKMANFLHFYSTDVKKVLGTGMTGDVFLVRHKGTNKKFACKKINKKGLDEGKLSKLRKEVNIMAQLDHPNIIKLVDAFEDEEYLVIISELCTGGELYDHLINAETYTQEVAASVFKQMVTAVNFCHQHDIAHRDLKLENFIITGYDSQKAPHLKLIDFGLSTQVTTKDSKGRIGRMKTTVGTAYYISPEVVHRSHSYGPECDIWSLGVILFMMLTGWPPFNGETDAAIIRAIKHQDADFPQAQWKSMPLAQDLVTKMLTRDPSKRIKGIDILSHPWMKQFECGAKSGILPREISASLRKFGSMQLFTRLAHQAATVTLNPEEVASLRKAFLMIDRDDSGGISKEEFRSAMAGRLDDTSIDMIFDKIDVNRSGDISYTEFLTASSASQTARSKSTLLAAFDRMDVDGSGYLECAELEKMLTGYFSKSEIIALTQKADLDHDGRIGRDEFVRLLFEK